MAEHNEISSDDDEDSSRIMGFIFGNVDNSGDLDVDYLDEDAKEHLSALASSLPDITIMIEELMMLLIMRISIDDGPQVTEEDHLLPKREYFSAAAALGSLYSKAFVFDDEDYDEEEEEEEEEPVEKAF